MSDFERLKDEVDFQMSMFDLVQAQLREREQCKRRQLSLELGVDCGTESIVQQQFKNEVDVNTIVERFGVTGQMPVVNTGGLYGDFSAVSDLGSFIELQEKVEQEFAALPADLREYFDNDPRIMAAYAGSVSEEEFSELMREYVLEAPSGAPVEAPAGAPEPAKPATPPSGAEESKSGA